jgi:hypothetical protein
MDEVHLTAEALLLGNRLTPTHCSGIKTTLLPLVSGSIFVGLIEVISSIAVVKSDNHIVFYRGIIYSFI